jgi:hypothetical protein
MRKKLHKVKVIYKCWPHSFTFKLTLHVCESKRSERDKINKRGYDTLQIGCLFFNYHGEVVHSLRCM